MGRIRMQYVTVKAGQPFTNGFDIGEHEYLAILIPAALDGAAAITFQAAEAADGGSPNIPSAAGLPAGSFPIGWQNVFTDTNVEATATFAAGVARAISMTVQGTPGIPVLAPFGALRIRLGTNAAPVNATVDRVLCVISKE